MLHVQGKYWISHPSFNSSLLYYWNGIILRKQSHEVELTGNFPLVLKNLDDFLSLNTQNSHTTHFKSERWTKYIYILNRSKLWNVELSKHVNSLRSLGTLKIHEFTIFILYLLKTNIRNNENILMLLITVMKSFKRKERGETKQTPIDRRKFSDFSNPFMKTKNNEKPEKYIEAFYCIRQRWW